jgi:hypothetical protein
MHSFITKKYYNISNDLKRQGKDKFYPNCKSCQHLISNPLGVEI